VSLPLQRSAIERAVRTRLGPCSCELAGRRSIVRAALSAAPALTIPQPRSGVQPVPAGRVAVSFSSRMTSAALRSLLKWRTSAAVAVTIGAAIDVPCR
jgi:hypothetical protein